MLDRSNKGVAKVIEIHDKQGLKAVEAWIQRTWNSALKFISENPPICDRDDIRQQIQAMRLAILKLPWIGVAGSTDLAILNYLLDVAYGLGSLTFDHATRTIADAVGIGRPTVNRSLKRLKRFISKTGANSSSTSRWELRLLKNDVDRSSIYLRGREDYWIDQRQPLPHDAWEHRGLGKGRLRTWTTLDVDHGVSAADVAAKLKQPQRTVTAHLKKLAQYGLARCAYKTWYRVERGLDEVAAILGTKGRRSKRKEQHLQEREEYHRRLQMQTWNDPDSNLIRMREASGETLEVDSATGEVCGKGSSAT